MVKNAHPACMRFKMQCKLFCLHRLSIPKSRELGKATPQLCNPSIIDQFLDYLGWCIKLECLLFPNLIGQDGVIQNGQ